MNTAGGGGFWHLGSERERGKVVRRNNSNKNGDMAKCASMRERVNCVSTYY